MSRWTIVGGLLLASCTSEPPIDDAGAMQHDAADGGTVAEDGRTVPQDDAAVLDDAGVVTPPVPGTWQGRMTGEVGGYPFEAALTLTVASSLQVTGQWIGEGRFASWNGAVSGLALPGDFDCSAMGPSNALCVSMIDPVQIFVPGILKGALTSSGGAGQWFFSVTDAFQDGGVSFMGEGTWHVE